MKSISVPFFVRMFVTWLVTAAPLVTWTPRAVGADVDNAPVAVVAVSSYDDVLKTIDSFGRLADRPQLRQMAEGTVAAYTGGRGLVGVDVNKPWGLAFQSHSGSWEVTVLVPVQDFPALLESLQLLSPGGMPEIEPGVYKLENPRGTVFVTLRDSFAVFVQTAEQFDRVPASPADLLDELAGEYDIAARVDMQELPRKYRSLVIQQVHQGAKLGLRKLPKESDEQFAARRRMTKMQLAELTTVIDETKHVTLGWKMDRQADSTLLDFSLTGIEGSKLAKQSASWKNVRSRFNGFLPEDASLTFGLTSPIAIQDVRQGLETLKLIREQLAQTLDKESVRASVNEMWSVLEDTIRQGNIDLAGFVNASLETPQFAAAIGVADADRLQESLQQLAKQFQETPVVDIQWNARQINGISFHRVTSKQEAKEGHELIVGFSRDAAQHTVYLAYDSSGDASALIEKAMEKSEQSLSDDVLPFRMSVTPSDFILVVPETHQQMPALAEVWRQTGGQDHVRLGVAPISNGCRYRFELDRALLKAFVTMWAGMK